MSQNIQELQKLGLQPLPLLMKIIDKANSHNLASDPRQLFYKIMCTPNNILVELL